MSRSVDSVLVLALGNDIIGDDGVALEAARALKGRLGVEVGVDVLESGESGLCLIDIMSPYDRVLLLDSIESGDLALGTVREFTQADFHQVLGPSPHYAGLPEVIALAKTLGIDFPQELRVLAIKIAPQEEFRQGLTEEIQQALPNYVDEAEKILLEWVH